jgi:AraC-like DNA-binding protein
MGGPEASLLANRRVSKNIERTLISLLLAGLPHSMSGAYNERESPAAPYYVKRAEAFIHDHIRNVLTVDDIASAAGVSTRTLYAGFKRWQNTNPMTYVKDAKLQSVRHELERCRTLEGGRVQEVATRFGFSNLSQFSRDYKARFGETPSTTLKAEC